MQSNQKFGNVGNADRIIRFALAAVFAGAYFAGYVHGTAGVVVLGLAVIAGFTGLVGFCPLYTLFGIRTCRATTQSCRIGG